MPIADGQNLYHKYYVSNQLKPTPMSSLARVYEDTGNQILPQQRVARAAPNEVVKINTNKTQYGASAVKLSITRQIATNNTVNSERS